MSKFEYMTDEMVAEMHEAAGSGVTEDVIETLMEDFGFPRRSVTAKLRKLGYDVPKKPGAAPVFSAEETDALADFLQANSAFIRQTKLLLNLLTASLLPVRLMGRHFLLK